MSEGPNAGVKRRAFSRVRLDDGLGRGAAGRSQRDVAGNGALNPIEAASAEAEEGNTSDGQRLDEQSWVTEREWTWKKSE